MIRRTCQILLMIASTASPYKVSPVAPKFVTAPGLPRSELGKHLTVKNKINAATGIRLRSQYKDLRALTLEEEKTAGLMCLAGKRVKAIKKRLVAELDRLPTDDEWAAACRLDKATLYQYIDLASKARNRLVQHNMRLAEFWVTKIYSYSNIAKDIPYIDLFAEAVVGLTRAAEGYNGSKRFGPYATIWIRSELYKGLTRLRPYNLASHRLMMMNYKIKKAEYELKESLQRQPSDEEIAGSMRMKMETLRSVRAAVDARIISADTPISTAEDGEGSRTYKDMMLRSDGDNFDVEMNVWRDHFRLALDGLTPFEKRTVCLRFGLIDGMPKGVGTTAELMSISPEAVRQTVHKSFGKLRSGPYADILAEGPPKQSPLTTIGKISARAY